MNAMVAADCAGTAAAATAAAAMPWLQLIALVRTTAAADTTAATNMSAMVAVDCAGTAAAATAVASCLLLAAQETRLVRFCPQRLTKPSDATFQARVPFTALLGETSPLCVLVAAFFLEPRLS